MPVGYSGGGGRLGLDEDLIAIAANHARDLAHEVARLPFRADIHVNFEIKRHFREVFDFSQRGFDAFAGLPAPEIAAPAPDAVDGDDRNEIQNWAAVAVRANHDVVDRPRLLGHEPHGFRQHPGKDELTYGRIIKFEKLYLRHHLPSALMASPTRSSLPAFAPRSAGKSRAGSSLSRHALIFSFSLKTSVKACSTTRRFLRASIVSL